MPKRLLIKDFIKEQIIKIVDEFNNKQWTSGEIFYTIKFRGAYLYCDIADGSGTQKMFRLEYLGDLNRWDFVVYAYSREKYDSNQIFFPGSNILDGTIQKSLEAGVILYNY